jgi:adenosylcobinamide-GDP ribazoletransferase
MTNSWLRGIAHDLKVCLLFSTRIPIPQTEPVGGSEIARASWALPVIGALVGLAGAVMYAAAHRFGLPPFVGASLALAVTICVTGCLHEDGLADTADGLFGGRDREARLDIMRDSRIGTYGAAALSLSLLLRVGALASLAGPAPVTLALVASHASARAVLPAFLRLVPPTRSDGLAAEAGRPLQASVALAAVLGTGAVMVALGLGRGIAACLLLLVALAAMRRLCLRLIGGQTGDVAGALEQVGEVAVLLVAAAAAR